MKKSALQRILPELPTIIIISSFIIFWLRAVRFKIIPFNLALLCVGLLINLPLFFAISPKGINFLKVLYKKTYGFFVVAFYLVYTAFQNAILVVYKSQPFNFKFSYIETVLALIPYYLWLPFCALVLSYSLFRKKSPLDIDKGVIFFLVIILSLSKIELLFFEFYIKKGLFTHFYKLILLEFKVEDSWCYLELYGIWYLLIPIVLVMMGAISHQTLNLKRWDYRTTKICLYFLAFFFLRSLVLLYFGYLSLASSSWMWNIATSFYPRLVRMALLEEVIFRGILQSWLGVRLNKLRCGEFFAILLTALLFGIYHYPFISTNWYQAAFMGGIFGWSYSKTKNLWVPIIIHGFYNIMLNTIFVPNQA